MILLRFALVILITTPVMLAILAIEDESITQANIELTEAQINNIQQLLIDHDPRLLINTDDQAIQLTESDLNALLNYFKSNFSTLSDAALSTNINPEEISINLSLPVYPTPFGQYANITLLAVPDGNFITIEAIEFGALRIPVQVYQPLFKLMQSTLQEDNNYRLFSTLLASVKQTSIEENSLSITLNWQVDNLSNISNQARQIFISAEESARLVSYYQQIADISNSFSAETRRVNLNSFLRPLFSTASTRTINGANPQDENRSIFIALSIYLTDLRLEQFVGVVDAADIASPKALRVIVESRDDLSQHIISSAALAASAGENIANILSVYKEVHDSRYRTGFSFSDITANQVGTNLGTLSAQSFATAVQLQNLLRSSQTETDFMPLVGRSDGVNEQDFINQYESRDSEVYQQRLVDIAQEISQRPIFVALQGNE